ncbi:hypothetical protein AB0933_08990 [Streptomyces venezuelae]|uniref:hypothetical protein n=1 Tax=Streptomyces venezuelae TaxID=54571 RepID=UPI0034565CA3
MAVTRRLVRKKIPKLPKDNWKRGVFIGGMLCISTGTAAVVARTADVATLVQAPR